MHPRASCPRTSRVFIVKEVCTVEVQTRGPTCDVRLASVPARRRIRCQDYAISVENKELRDDCGSVKDLLLRYSPGRIWVMRQKVVGRNCRLLVPLRGHDSDSASFISSCSKRQEA